MLRIGGTVYSGLEIGGFLGYSHMYREGGIKKFRSTQERLNLQKGEYESGTGTQTLIWPENTTTFLRYGIAFHWHFG